MGEMVTCEAIEEEANAFAVRGTDEVSIAEERLEALVEGNGREVESCVGKGESERKKESKEQKQRPTRWS